MPILLSSSSPWAFNLLSFLFPFISRASAHEMDYSLPMTDPQQVLFLSNFLVLTWILQLLAQVLDESVNQAFDSSHPDFDWNVIA